MDYNTIYIFAMVLGFVLSIFILRLLGAWLFRINEVILLLKDIKEELKNKA